jgi:site-specific DNA-methyltransferase (adenine-specific)
MKFDVIVGNPPYQLNVGVESKSFAISIYDKFVQQAKKLNPRYLTMIIPARWYAGGRGLDNFRDEMLNDNRIRILHDFPDATNVFPGVQIKGGVCYFLWDRENKGFCKIINHLANEKDNILERGLLEENANTFIRYNKSVSILRKVRKIQEKSFSKWVS